MVRSRAWISLLILAPVAAAAIFTRPYLAFEGLPEYSIEVLAWVLFFCGVAVRWWATLFIGGRKDAALVTQGPYSVCRNPLYLGTLLITLSVGVFLQSLSLLLATALVGAGYVLITVPVEERKLAERYGRSFDEYRQRVPCLLPNFSLLTEPAEIRVIPCGIHAEFKRSIQYAAIPLICYLIEHLRMMPSWPTFFTLP
ncbi:MAG TPA: isoprenylcysteine carboxylmethyltransferase family protein [Pirellulaceae bacterium]|nr:isoprenylcysteine carboxylmethyltransferase family protein [Pirellulaceae bacterium]